MIEHSYLQPETAAAAMFRFLRIELVRAGAGQTEMHMTPAYTLCLFTEGGGNLVLETGMAALHRGTCLAMEPGTACRIEVGDEGLACYRLQFEIAGRSAEERSGSGLKALDALLRQAVAECGSFSSCLLLAESLYRHGGEQDELERLDNQIRFQTLLLSILRELRAAGAGNDARQAVRRSVEYVREHYDRPITIEQLAAMAETSRWRYTQLFKEATGQIPIDFLNTIRIDKAQQLLLLTRDKLNDIAQAVGYSNEYYFNRKFKMKVGVAPGQYRSSYPTSARIFAPFLEDYLLALGVTPVVQCAHELWGKQEYLGLREVPEFDVAAGDWSALSRYKPEFIILDGGYRRWDLEKCSRISPVFKMPYTGEDWRAAMQAFGTILGRPERAAQEIADMEHTLAEARSRLARTARKMTVAVLRISSKAIHLYGGSGRGYTGPVLYGDLGLTPPSAVRQIAPYERRIRLTPEDLARLDADHLFVVFDKGDGEGDGRELLDTPVWRSLPAVRGGRVYEADFFAWMNYGVLSHRRKVDDVLRVIG